MPASGWSVMVVALVVGCGGMVGPSTAARPIYRCQDQRGALTLQSDPCGPAMRQVEVRHYPEPGPNPEAARRLRRVEEEMDRRNRSAARQARPVIRYEDGRSRRRLSRCERARRQRDRAFEDAGMQRDFDLSRQMDTRVAAACR